MRPLLSALAVLACTAAALPAHAQQAPAEFDPSDFGKIVIQPRQAAGGAGGFVLEQAFGDYQNEPIIEYGENSPAVRLGRPIGRLDMLFDNGKTGFCTAFIVDDQHILTNHHCVPGMDRDPSGKDSGVQAAQLVMGFIKPGRSEGVDRYTVSPQIVETSRELDYSVLRVFGNPSTKYGKLELAMADPEDSEFLWIIGHPQGQAQHISREGCAAATPAISEEGKLVHSCDTLGGNSGSPVIRISDKRVVGLHHAGDSRTGFNMAIPMTRILPQSSVLKAAVGPNPTPAPTPKPAPTPVVTPKPAVNACTALWSEAKLIGCAGYEAYVEECGNHTFASMARRVIERECAIPSVAPRASDTPLLTVKANGGGDYSSLADAVARAEPGTRIEVYPGTYTKGLDIDKPVEIVGVGDPSQIILAVPNDNAINWTAPSGRVARMTVRQTEGKFFGIHIAGGSVIMEDLDVTAAELAVIAIRGNEGATIRRSTIHDGSEGGIFIFDNGKALLEDNLIYGNKFAGVEVKSGGNPVVRGNTMRDGNGSGIFVNEGGSGRYENNTVVNNRLAGIEVKAAHDVYLIGNVVRNGQQGGVMWSNGATGRMENNTVYNNAYAGLEIKANANPVVYNNEFRDGQQSALYIHENGKGVIENNTIHHNAFYGISVKDGSNPIVRDNVISDNVYEAIRVRLGATGTYENNDLSGNTAGAFRIEADAGNLIRRGNIE
ncbi:right-handed parallel beta-helix repeat-containing protein [Tropicibacter naphthalenivorans]|uniref:Serine protease n=1 Tax=Tropicibacter naphthalenivorans TaxID=441103 RepID=A0A0P1G6D8_9RHOB|nr:right-handed parallel beta-helix repeat-containing protein [Tropicibacter naphthalenivorans]CUH77298.1 parallel beta-helix repeat [Tropicibacter naphthalenivorans]SMC59155.1 parallel beta-helix repeat (two copies) [Tropicibacter naphthalenivorans]